MKTIRDIFEKLFRLVYPHKDPILLKRIYGMPETLDLNVRMTQDGWFVVSSPNLPGLITQARDHQELIEMVNDAVLTYFDVPRRDADIVYDQIKLGDTLIQYKMKLQTKAA